MIVSCHQGLGGPPGADGPKGDAGPVVSGTDADRKAGVMFEGLFQDQSLYLYYII